jgi:hypothetical protein
MSTDISPVHATWGKLTRASSNTTVTVFPSSAGIPGFAMATAADVVVAIPIEKPGNPIMLAYIASAASSVAYYPQLDIAFGNGSTDPAPMSGVAYANLSTVDLAWKGYISTAIHGGTAASEAVMYTLMIDTAKFAHNFGGTSSAIQDTYESFIYVMPTYSSKATVSGHSAAAALVAGALSTDTALFVGAFQTPQ